MLVDTSVWIDHLHRAEPRLVSLLGDDAVVIHEGVIEELALGSIRNRHELLSLLAALRRAPVLRHDELLTLVDSAKLWGRGLGVIDVQLLGAARIAGLTLWTRDRRLRSCAAGLGVAILAE